MLMEGHQGEVFTLQFHPEGQYMASAGFDRQIYIWNVYGDCENIGLMSGHSGAIMELQFSTDGNTIVTASTDSTLGLWDIESGTRIKKLKGHTSFVNTCHQARRGPPMICSGSDDCSVRIWDPRKRNQCTSLNSTYQVTACSFNDTAEQVIYKSLVFRPWKCCDIFLTVFCAAQAFSGGIDNDIKVWDLRRNAILYRLKGHVDTVTGLALSPDGSYLLSNAMDNTVSVVFGNLVI